MENQKGCVCSNTYHPCAASGNPDDHQDQRLFSSLAHFRNLKPAPRQFDSFSTLGLVDPNRKECDLHYHPHGIHDGSDYVVSLAPVSPLLEITTGYIRWGFDKTRYLDLRNIRNHPIYFKHLVDFRNNQSIKVETSKNKFID